MLQLSTLKNTTPKALNLADEQKILVYYRTIALLIKNYSQIYFKPKTVVKLKFILNTATI